jgi:hypothetical protein
MSINQLWHLNDDLSIHDAVCLIAGYDPNDYDIANSHFGYDEHQVDFPSYSPVHSALITAARLGKIKVRFSNDNINDEVSHPKTTIQLDDLKEWLVSRGFKSGFLFEGDNINKNDPDYLNPNHPRYAPKLAASVKAWLAMSDDNLLHKKTPIQAMSDWLESRYKEFDLIHKQTNEKAGYKKGDINSGAIKEAAKVANWNQEGGAPKTPTSTNLPTIKDNLPTPIQSPSTVELDDDIPF